MPRIPRPWTNKPANLQETVSNEDLLDWYATEIFPPLPDNRKGSAYRRMIRHEFFNCRSGDEPRRLDNVIAYRSGAMSRLDRSITTVA